MNKRRKATVTIEPEVVVQKRKRPPVTEIPDQWEVKDGVEQPQYRKPLSSLNRCSESVHRSLMRVLSNLRLSLTLRIAIYAAGQLLRSTLLVLLIAAVALCVAQVPAVDQAVDTVLAVEPAGAKAYTEEQLRNLPFAEVYLLPEPYPDGLAGFARQLGLMFSDFIKNGEHRALLYRNTVMGGVVFAYRVDNQMHIMNVMLWTLLCCDLFRVLYFLKHRNRLNKKVLKPITDMAETAATLSANNLSDRISVEGAKNELKDLALVINGMLDRIELSYNSQKQFVSDASHELRTPIAVIQGYVNMLERWGKTDKEVLDEGITAIAQEAMSMKELVERLLFLARHDKKTLMLEMEDFNPLEVMSEVHREAKLISTAHSFGLSPSDNAQINGDKGMIKQLMRILVDNAIKYTPEGGSITLGVKNTGDTCVLSVTDTGEGISAKDLTKIFDRFYRCDEARKSQTSGHGLGLSIARIIAVAHGGKINVRSKVGAGTTFSVILPLIKPA
ncbi:MAG: HAMP domain-containing sensor histidine kinase [Eubacteriales bacterium]|nr:HAMP domain-containing sensor histidine kinase [Eubacteriales bacterium]